MILGGSLLQSVSSRGLEIGRAAWRERGFDIVEISGGGGLLKKKKKKLKTPI